MIVLMKNSDPKKRFKIEVFLFIYLLSFGIYNKNNLDKCNIKVGYFT